MAGFLETSVKEVKAHWPEDAVPVKVAGAERWWLGGDEPEPDAGLVRLLGGFDLLLQGRDRDLLVPDKSRHKALWPYSVVPARCSSGPSSWGPWRPKTAGKRFTLRLELWDKVRARCPRGAGAAGGAAGQSPRAGAGGHRRGLSLIA